MGFKLLVVDDNPGDQRLLKEALLELALDCEIICAANGPEAVQLAFLKRPDLILMDIMIPGLSGGEITRLIKKNIQTMGIPIIFISGVIGREDESASKGVMINDEKYPCLAKPVNPQKLLEMINCLIIGS